jgi:DNA primase
MDLISWLLSRGAKVRKGGKEYCVDCPKCGDVKKHMYINPDMGVAHCFRCGYSATIEEVLVQGFGLPFIEVRELLWSFKKMYPKTLALVKDGKTTISFPEESIELHESGIGVQRLLMEWCKQNYIDYKDLVDMRCRWWNGRLVIPCWQDRDRSKLWYWIARAISDIEPKYLNCSAPKEGVVWGVDWYDVSDGYLYVCEGWKDAYRMRGLALLGKDITDAQLKSVSGLVADVKVRVLLDSDAWREGILVGMKLARKIGYSSVEVGFLMKLKDPGEGKDRDEVLQNTVFVNMEGGIGNLITLLKKLGKSLVDQRWTTLSV